MIRHLVAFALLSYSVSGQDLSSVAVRIQNRHGSTISTGSGAIVAANGETALVLTCRHLFEDGIGDLVVHRTNGKGFRAKFLGADPDKSDLAAIAIKNPGDTTDLEIADRPARQATSVGFAGGALRAIRRTGKYLGSGYLDQRWTTNFYGFVPEDGDSGGPVFDEAGRLSGVVWGTNGAQGSVVGTSEVRRFLTHPTCLAFRRKNRPEIIAVGPSPEQPQPVPAQPIQPTQPTPTQPPISVAGPPGVQGPAGPPGPPGPVGPAPDVAVLIARIKALEDQVAKPITFATPNPDGSVVQIPVHLGESVGFRIPKQQ